MGMHTATFPGKRVRIITKDGVASVGIFVERSPSGIVVIRGTDGKKSKFKVRDIQSFQLWPKACG